jgi:CRP-like cAMP-binding protein
MLKDQIAAASDSAWLSSQPASFRAAICAKLRPVRLNRQERLFHAEDDSPAIYFLATGSIVSVVPHPAGYMIPGESFLPGDWFGLPAALGLMPRIATTEARRESLVLRLPVRDLLAIVGSDAAYAKAIPQLLAGHMEALALHGLDLLTPDSRSRLCARLLTLGGRRRGTLPRPGALIPFSKEELALTSNMFRQRVHQVLGELLESGICDVGYGFVVIRDPAALAIQFPAGHQR